MITIKAKFNYEILEENEKVADLFDRLYNMVNCLYCEDISETIDFIQGGFIQFTLNGEDSDDFERIQNELMKSNLFVSVELVEEEPADEITYEKKTSYVFNLNKEISLNDFYHIISENAHKWGMDIDIDMAEGDLLYLGWNDKLGHRWNEIKDLCIFTNIYVDIHYNEWHEFENLVENLKKYTKEDIQNKINELNEVPAEETEEVEEVVETEEPVEVLEFVNSVNEEIETIEFSNEIIEIVDEPAPTTKDEEEESDEEIYEELDNLENMFINKFRSIKFIGVNYERIQRAMERKRQSRVLLSKFNC